MHIRRARALEAGILTNLVRASKKAGIYEDRPSDAQNGSFTIDPQFIFWNEVFIAEIDGKITGFYALVKKQDMFRLAYLSAEQADTDSGVRQSLFYHACRRAVALRAAAIEIISEPDTENFFAGMGAVRMGTKTFQLEGGLKSYPLMQINLIDTALF